MPGRSVGRLSAFRSVRANSMSASNIERFKSAFPGFPPEPIGKSSAEASAPLYGLNRGGLRARSLTYVDAHLSIHCEVRWASPEDSSVLLLVSSFQGGGAGNCDALMSPHLHPHTCLSEVVTLGVPFRWNDEFDWREGCPVAGPIGSVAG